MQNHQRPESGVDSIVQTFTDAVLAEKETTEDIFDYLREVMIAVTVMVSELRKQGDTDRAALTETNTALDEILRLLRSGDD